MKQTTKDGLDMWAQHGVPPGDFIRNVLENNLAGAFRKADMQNTLDMHEIVGYMYNYLPAGCWGSKEKMKAWADYIDAKKAEPATSPNVAGPHG